MRRTLALLGAAVLLAACSETSGPVRLTLANVHSPGYPTADALARLDEEVASREELAGVDLDPQLGGVLGGEKEVLEKVRFGAVAMYAGSVAPLAEFVPEIGVLSLPYLFRDEAHFREILDGPVGDELLAALEGSGYVGLAWYDAGARSFYNRARPVRRLEDLRGLKIRVQSSELMRATVESLGATPVSIGFKQVYTNLQTGTIDGAENNLPSYRSERHFEVAPHYSLDEHSRVPDVILIHEGTWNRLSPAEQTALRDAARASSRIQRDLWTAYRDEARRALADAGAQIVEVQDLEAFRAAVEPVYERFGPRFGGWVGKIREKSSTEE